MKLMTMGAPVRLDDFRRCKITEMLSFTPRISSCRATTYVDTKLDNLMGSTAAVVFMLLCLGVIRVWPAKTPCEPPSAKLEGREPKLTL